MVPSMWLNGMKIPLTRSIVTMHYGPTPSGPLKNGGTATLTSGWILLSEQGSDTVSANSDLVLTRYVSLLLLFPLILISTLYASPLSPALDYAPLVGTPVVSWMYPFILITLYYASPVL